MFMLYNICNIFLFLNCLIMTWETCDSIKLLCINKHAINQTEILNENCFNHFNFFNVICVLFTITEISLKSAQLQYKALSSEIFLQLCGSHVLRLRSPHAKSSQKVQCKTQKRKRETWWHVERDEISSALNEQRMKNNREMMLNSAGLWICSLCQ